MRNKQVLLKAADLIEKYGWIRGRDGSRLMGFCISGALREAASGTEEIIRTCIFYNFRNFLVGKFDSYPHAWSISGINDRYVKTGEQAIELLREAARKED